MHGLGKLTLRSLEVFVAVVETGSVAGAATRLKASPSTVSQQLSNLESTIGAKLLDRMARPIAMTPAGYLLHTHAQSILDELSAARAKLMELQLASLPRLRLGMIDDLDTTLTPDLVGDLKARYPACVFSARSGRSDEHLMALQERQADIVVAADVDEPESWCERHVLLREAYVLVTAKGLLRPGCDVVEAIMMAPFVRYSSHIPMGQRIEQHLRRLRLVPEQRFEFDTTPSVFAMVKNCRGWALTTPLSYMHGELLHDDVDVSPLPFVSFFRTVSLRARRNELGDLPRQLAGMCRDLIEDRAVAAAANKVGWFAEALRVERPEGQAEVIVPSRQTAEES